MKKVSTILMLALAFALVASTTSAAGYTFTKGLKEKSSGAGVIALQTILVSQNLLTMPAGVDMGYYGKLTVSAVKAYQVKKGLSPVGFVGPATAAALNNESAVVGGVSTPGCAAGAMFSSTTGVACTTTTTTGGTTSVVGIATPGVEGTLSVTAGPVANTNVYVGQSKVQVLNLKLQAQNSDISAQRVQVDLGSNSAVYTKAFTTLYVIADNGTVLASLPLNQTTVTKNTNFYATLGGFNYIVSKNTTRYLTIAVDVAPAVDTTYQTTYTIALASQGVRGVDGAGIVQYTNSGTLATQNILVNASLSDSANLKISTNGATPAAGVVIASSGSTNDQADKVTVLAFDIKAEKDAIGVTSLNASTTLSGSADITGAYLYDGSTLVASAAVGADNSAFFTNIGGTSGYVIPKDTTKTFTLQVDVRSASTTPGTLAATIVAAGVSAQNSQGTTLAASVITGNAGSNNLTVQKSGPVFALVGTPVITKSQIGTTASSTFATSFTFSVAAKGTSVTIASSSAMVIGIYVNGTRVATTSAVYSRPVNGTTLEAVTGNYVIADGQAATFSAQTSFVGPNATYTPAGGIVTARLESVSGGNTYLSDTFRAENLITL